MFNDEDLTYYATVEGQVSIKKNKFFCQRGNIIGSSLSVGMSIEVKDIGNRVGTKTSINLGLDRPSENEKTTLLNQKNQLEDSLKQLNLLGEKLAQTGDTIDSKMRITLLRQRNSLQKTEKKLENINQEIANLEDFLGDEEKAELIIRNELYSNVIVAFGKYERKINRNRKHVCMKLEDNEIVMHSIE